MNRKSIFFIALFAIISMSAKSNWIAGDESVSPSSPIPACSTVTASGSFTWLSFNNYINDNHSATLSYALPSSVVISSGTPSLTYLNNTPVVGAIFTMNTGGWNCTFAPGTIFPPGTKFIFKISNLDIVDTPSLTNQQLTHFISFLAGPPNENYTDNVRTITFNTTAIPTVTANATATSITVGQSITLTGGGASTYTWDSATVQNGVPFMPPAGTHIYTVTGSDANGCSATSSITINVAASSGNWIAGDESVSPSSPIPACSTLTASGSFTWLSFNTYSNDNHLATLSYTLPNSVNIASGTPSLTYLNNATVLGANFSMTTTGWDCTFDPGTTFPAGTKFIFRISNLDIVDTPGFVNQPLTHSISYATPPNGEIFTDNSKTITFSTTPTPTVTASSTSSIVCAGDSVTLTGGGASTYTWTGGVMNGVAFVPTATTTYTVTGTDANGCTGTSTVTVTVGGIPTVMAYTSHAGVCVGDSVTLIGYGATPAFPLYFTWDNGVTNAVPFAPTVTNTYTVTGSDGNGCTATSTVTVAVGTPPAAPTLTTVDPICINGNGTITVTAPTGANFEYTIDGVNYQSSTIFSVPAGTYNVRVRNTLFASCPSAPTIDTLNAGTTSCGPNVGTGALAAIPAISSGDTATLDYFVSNSGIAPTFGSINVLISKPPNGALSISLPTGWSLVASTPSAFIITTTNVIQPGIANRETIPAVFIHNGSSQTGTTTFNITAQPGSGGETNGTDNSGATFIQIN